MLGRPAIWAADGPRPLVGDREAGLLGLLATTPGRTVPALRLEEELWQGRVSESALRVAVNRLRQRWRTITGAEAPIVRDPTGYRLDVDPTLVDSHAYAELVEQGRQARLAGRPADAVRLLDRADGLWRGVPCEGCDEIPTLRLEAQRLVEVRAAADEERALALLDDGHPVGAADAAALLLADHPYRESAWACRIIALARAGRPSDALRAFEAARRRLDDDLGIRPSDDLCRLQVDLLEGRSAAALTWPGARMAPAPPPGHPPPPPGHGLVGRDDALGRGDEVVRRARAEGLRVLVVEGEPGIGKTALLEAIARRAAPRDLPVAIGRGDPGGAIPLRALLQALDPWIGPRGGPAGLALAALLDRPDDQRAALPEDLSLRRHRIVSRIGEVVAEAARQGLGVVVLDDAQALDPLAVAAVGHLLAHHRDVPVVLALGLRRTDDAAEVRTRLVEQSPQVPIERIELRPLTRDELTELVPDAGDVHDASGGNPLYALQLARARREGGADGLRARADLLDICRLRVEALDPATRSVVEAAAVLGDHADLVTLAAVTGETLPRTATLVATARRAGILDGGDALDATRFVHGIIAEAAGAGIEEGRRRELHLGAARAIDPAAVVEIADHLLAAWPAVEVDDVVAAASAAAQSGLALGDTATVTRFLRIVLEMSRPDDTRTARARLGLALRDAGAEGAGRLDVLAALVDEARGAGGGGAGRLDVLAALVDEARAAARWDVFADAVVARRQFGIAPTIPQAEAEVADIDEALARLPRRDGTRRAHLLAWRADLLVNVDAERSATSLAQARRLAATLNDDRVDVLCRFVEVRTLDARCAPPAACVAAARPLLDRAIDDHHAALTAIVGPLCAGAHLRAGDLDAAAAVTATAREAAEGLGSEVVAAALDVAEVGQVMAARSVAEVDARSGATTDGEDALAVTARFVHLTVIRHEQRRLAEIEPVLLAALSFSSRRYPRPLVAAARLEAGDVTGGAAQLALLADEVDELDVDWIYIPTLALTAELAAATGDARLGAACAERLVPFAGEVVVGCSGLICLGRVDRYLGLAHAATGDLDTAIAALGRARALDTDGGLPLWAGWAAADEARVRRSVGEAPDDALLAQAAAAARTHGSARLAHALATTP